MPPSWGLLVPARELGVCLMGQQSPSWPRDGWPVDQDLSTKRHVTGLIPDVLAIAATITVDLIEQAVEVAGAESVSVKLGQQDLLRLLLVRWLRVNGHRKLCKGEPADYSWRSARISVNFIFSILLGLWIYSIIHLGWGPWQGLGVISGVLLVGGALIGYGRLSPALFYLLFLILWLGLAVELVLRQGIDSTLSTHLLPLVLVPTLRGIGSAARIAVQLPLFIPVALIIVLLPLLTEDPWRLAAESRGRLAWFAGLALLPPLVLLAWRILRSDPRVILESATERLSAFADHDKRVLKAIKKMRHGSDEILDDDVAKRGIVSALAQDHPDGTALKLLEAARISLRLRSARRLGSLALGISVIVWVLIYLLALASMPTSLAAEWSEIGVPLQAVSLAWVDVTLPLGPYVWVSTLLAIVACAGFLGFALTEDQHSDALWDAIVQRPAEDYVMVALTYVGASAEVGVALKSEASSGQGVDTDSGRLAPQPRSRRKRGRSHVR